ncbi:MAG: ABC transporter permease subunit, partial [Ornithinimicrobium sp.]
MTTTTAPTHHRPSQHTSPALPFAAVVNRSIMDRLPLTLIVGTLMMAMGLLIGALWPSLQDTFADLEDQLPDAFNAMLGGVGLGTPVGWANAELVALIAPMGAIAVAVIAATRSTAGEEEDKTLGILLSTPVSRPTFM